MNSESLIVVAGPDVPCRASVVVPAYERVGPLRALLESLTIQGLSSGSFEVIVSDDGSGPEVAETVKSFAGAFERLVLVRGPNAGPGIARNRGASAAVGGVLAFIDSDCLALPGWLERLVCAVERGSGMAHGPVHSSVPPIEPFVHSIHLEGPGTLSGMFAIRRSLFQQLGGFPPELSRAGEDHAFLARASSAGVAPDFTADAPVLHPPRLKRVAIRESRGPAQPDWALTIWAMCHRVPGWRLKYARENRWLVLKAAAKTGLILAPLTVPVGRPWVWPSGLAFLVALAFRKWFRANERLAAAGEGIRIPFSDAIRYAVLLPVADLRVLITRAWNRVLFLH